MPGVFERCSYLMPEFLDEIIKKLDLYKINKDTR